MLGPVDGAVVMIEPIGPTCEHGIGEGIESTTAAMQYWPGVAGWAAASDGGMRKFAAWLRANIGVLPIKRLHVWADAKRAGIG